MYQIAAMGQALARADSRGRPAEYFARQIRQVAMNGVLVPEKMAGVGRTSARLFSYESLLKAKIASALVDVGLPVEVQKQAIGILNSPDFQAHWEAQRDSQRSTADSKLFLCVLQSDAPTSAGSTSPWEVVVLHELENAAVFPLLGDHPVMLVLDLAALLRRLPDAPGDAMPQEQAVT